MGVRVSRPLCRDPHVLLDADAELDLDLAIMLDLKSFRGSIVVQKRLTIRKEKYIMFT